MRWAGHVARMGEGRGRDGGTNFVLRIKEQETRLTLQEHDDDDDVAFCVYYVLYEDGLVGRNMS